MASADGVPRGAEEIVARDVRLEARHPLLERRRGLLLFRRHRRGGGGHRDATSFSAPLVASSRTRAADGGGAFARASPAGSPGSHSHSATSRLRMPFARATATVLQGAPKSSAAGAWGGTNGVTSEWVSKAQFLTCYGAIHERPSPRNPRHAIIRMAVTSE